MDLAGKRVLVVGLGVSGLATARLLRASGVDVRVSEAASSAAVAARAERLRAEGVEVEMGGHELARAGADLVVVSPGIPPTADVVRSLRAAGARLISEVELASWLADCDFLAVTGTNGKTTTTTLLAAMLAEAGLKSVAAGNIGLPLIEAISMVPSGGAIALEVSSFQLDAVESFRPRVAVLLNVGADHIDWHGSFDAYFRAKARIVQNQGRDDVFVANLDDDRAMEIASTARSRVVPFSARRPVVDGIGVHEGMVAWRGKDVIAVSDVPAVGLAALEDAVAAAGAALEYGVEIAAVVRAVKGFRSLPHRLELVAQIDGVSYIDDSKATNPHATMAAVQGLEEVVLIAGGRSKGIDLSALAATVPPVAAVVTLGEAADEVEEVFRRLVPVARAASMREAVDLAHGLSSPGGSVLLSPGCASLDMYESYAARGEDFARAVQALATSSREGNDGES